MVVFYAVWAALAFWGLLSVVNDLAKAGKSPFFWILGSGTTVFLLAYAAYHGV